MASSDGRNTSAQTNLRQQNLTELDVTKLSALSPEVISRQATINIGTIGHVAHGKSTVVKAISGVQTVRFKNELERNITIKLERLSDTIVKLIRDRAAERDESAYFEKTRKAKKRNLSPEPDDSAPPTKKKKGSKQGPGEFIIDKIYDFKFESGKEYFYVKWKGYNDDDNTWEPIENLDNCPLILSTFVSDLELKHCDELFKLQQELSFCDLLCDSNLVTRLRDIEDIDLSKVKQDMLLKLLIILTLDEGEEAHGASLVEETRDLMQLYVAARRRGRQLIELKQWEDHLNQVDSCKKLTVENKVDFAPPPEDFKYINGYIPGAGVTIPTDPPIGCECTACNCRARACCGNQGGLFAYTAKRRLRVASGTPVYECNKACKCSADCQNRVVQGGRTVKLCIFRTHNGRGWGVRTEQRIGRGTFICLYVGEVITFEEAEKRGREYDANGLTYLFDLDFNSVENPYTVDAAQLGNVSHFINHSCEPNLGVWAVWADCLDPNLPMIALFATEDIEAGEEICFDYLQKCSEPEENAPAAGGAGGAGGVEPAAGAAPHSPARPAAPQTNKAHRNHTECKCGALKCRKYLF